MATTKKYFHDHFVMLMASVNIFLSLFDVVFIIIKLYSQHTNIYFIQYRPRLGVIDAYKTGKTIDIVSFILFALLVGGFNVAISYKAYKIHRQIAATVLLLGSILLVVNCLVANSLIIQR